MLAPHIWGSQAPETEKSLKTQLLGVSWPAPTSRQRLLPITRSTPLDLLSLVYFGGVFTGEV